MRQLMSANDFLLRSAFLFTSDYIHTFVILTLPF
jgi:hypothetical protein